MIDDRIIFYLLHLHDPIQFEYIIDMVADAISDRIPGSLDWH